MAIRKHFLEIYRSRSLQIGMDIIRIALVVLVIIFIYILIKEIEAVKILLYDPCEICMNRTGCNCFCMPSFN